MALKISTDLKNYIINQGLIKTLAGTAGTGGTASLKIYTGAQPANADAGTSGSLLVTISGIGWGTVGSAGTVGTTSGTAALNSTAGYSGTAVLTGTAGWGRLETVGLDFTGNAATHRIDGDVGTAATSVFVINSTTVTSGGVVSLLTAPIYLA